VTQQQQYLRQVMKGLCQHDCLTMHLDQIAARPDDSLGSYALNRHRQIETEAQHTLQSHVPQHLAKPIRINLLHHQQLTGTADFVKGCGTGYPRSCSKYALRVRQAAAALNQRYDDRGGLSGDVDRQMPA